MTIGIAVIGAGRHSRGQCGRRGHDAVYWSTWLAALHAVDPDMCVNIEHEDVSLGRIEGLEVASKVLLDAARCAGLLTSGSA